jgi:Ca2+/H+ antiporter, TMEM165/GDT1 family
MNCYIIKIKVMEKRLKAVKIMGMVVLGLLFIPVIGLVVMGLWNAVLPAVLGVKTIGFWQALGIFALSKILFGGFKGGGHRKHEWRRKMHDKWEQMSPEERQQWKQNLRNRCGNWGKPMPDTTNDGPINTTTPA